MSRERVGKRTRALSSKDAERLKREAMRELAARLAHQLGNLLQVVSGNLELIAQRTTDETALRYIANARLAAEQLTELTRTLQDDGAR
jgi:signal transduction histidine kinase